MQTFDSSAQSTLPKFRSLKKSHFDITALIRLLLQLPLGKKTTQRLLWNGPSLFTTIVKMVDTRNGCRFKISDD